MTAFVVPQLRPATNADAPAIRDLVFSILREYHLAPDPASTDADLNDIESSYHARGGRFDVLVASDNTIIGSVGLYPTEPGAVELRKMYLHRDHRGRGLGRLLLEHALAEARRMGFGRVTLETASVLKEAVSLYTRFGFRPYQTCHCSARCDQTYCLDLTSVSHLTEGDRAGCEQ